MVVSQARIDRLRREADTIFTRIESVEEALSQARERDGDHWEEGLTLELEAPDGETIAVELDVETSAAENAQRRYERAGELQAELDERREVAGELAVFPLDPVAILVFARLAEDGAATSRTLAGAVDADHDRVHDLCTELAGTELVTAREDERSESSEKASGEERPAGSEDDRREFSKDASSDGVTRYELTADGEELWDHLQSREGKATLLDLHEEMARLSRRLHSGGPDYAQKTAADLGMDRDRVRTLYAAMDAVGLVQPYEGSIIKGSERKLSPKDETHKKHTYFVTTTVADRILRDRK